MALPGVPDGLISTASVGYAIPGKTYWVHPGGDFFEGASYTNYRQGEEGGYAAGGKMLDGSEVNKLIQQRKDSDLQKTITAQTQPQIDALQKRLNEATSQDAAAKQIANLAGTGLQNNLQASNMLYTGGTPNFNEQTGTYNAVAGGIQQLAGGKTDPALLALSAERNYGASPLAAKLNFQVSDAQILNDYNTAKVDRYKRVVELGNTQAVGIQERLTAAEKLLSTLPANSAQRTASDVYVDGLKKDLASVRSAVSDATSQIKNFKPFAVGSPEAAKEITSFRSFLQLPEERASQQLRQIDPESYDTSVQLGRQYRELAGKPVGQTQNAQTEAFRSQLEKGYKDYSGSGIGATQDAQTEAYRAQVQKQIQDYSLGRIGATTTPEAEALRRQVEGEMAAQLALGSRLGVEEQRQYQQAARGAQSARGNIFGIAPAVEEAVTTGMAGEARKQARYGAASQFLSSGQTTSDALARDTQLREALQQGRYQTGGAMLSSGQTVSDALARDVQLRNALQQSRLGAGGQFLTSGQTMSDALRGDIAFRDALQQNRMGAAANFVAGGPSVYNLAQARTAGQQNAFQNYIQANQALPGGFNQQPSTAGNFYQTTNPEIPVALTNAFNSLYSSMAGYQANTYGAQVGAISRQQSGSQKFADIAGGIASLGGAAAPKGFFGAPSSGAFFY